MRPIQSQVDWAEDTALQGCNRSAYSVAGIARVRLTSPASQQQSRQQSDKSKLGVTESLSS